MIWGRQISRPILQPSLSRGDNVFIVECYFTYFGSTVENSKEKFSHPNKFFSKGDSTIKAPLIIKGKDKAKIQNACSKSSFAIANHSVYC